MRALAMALVSIGLLSGCEGRAASGSPATEAQATAAPAAAPNIVAAEPEEPAAEPEEPAAEPSAPEPATIGECATSERCAVAAEAQERQGHHEHAAALYGRACELGLGQACHRLGEQYRAGKGVAPDDDRARALFEQGCRQGSEAACDALGH